MAEGIQIKNLPSTTTIKQGDTMTIVQDKQNKQLSLDVFANESDLATLSPLENRCDEVKAKIEVDEYSAEITTSQSMSKIGSGDNGANLHENVLDGAYESCVLKGKTKYIDNDTQEILDTFQDGRNLSLIDVKSPILTTTGKNLYTGEQLMWTIDSNNTISPHSKESLFYFRCKPNTTYTFTTLIGEQYRRNRVHECYEEPKVGVVATLLKNNISTNTTTITTSANAKYIVWQNFNSDNGSYTIEDLIQNAQIEEGSTATTYEPYKTNILSFNQKDDKTIVLRSLPNGVCDTLNVETGEYVQRIGEVVLDGTKHFGKNMSESEYNKPCVRVSCTNALVNGSSTPQFNMRADKIAIGNYSYNMNYPVMAGLHEQALYIYIPRTIIGLTTNDNDAESIANAFNSWLTRNPITVQYPLATPIVSTVDVQGFPYAYKNGHIQLSSGSTEPSLTPTVTYKVPVSRVGQLASNTKSNLRQTIKLDQLEILAYQSLINAEYENLLVQNSAESAASFTNLSTNDPKDELYYMLKHLIEEDQPVQNMLDKINLFYLYGLLSDEHYFDLLLGGEEDVY